MDQLPDELLLRILDFLPPRNILVAGKVCVRWSRLSHDARLWRHRTCQHWWSEDAEAVAFFRETPAMRSVAFTRAVDSVVTRCLATHCSALTTLLLDHDQRMGYRALRALTRNCGQISHLRVSCVILRCPRRARLVAQMPSLAKLVVWGDSEPNLRDLASGCLALRSIDLLDVGGRLADLGVPLLERLEELIVRWKQVTPTIRHCAKNLRRLRLERYATVVRRDADLAQDLQHLRDLSHFSSTDLSATPVLMYALLLPKLRSLKLEQPCFSVHDGLVLDICRLCPRLEELDISGSEFVTSLGLRDLWRLRRLRSLNLSKCYLLDGGSMDYLARCRALEELYLEDLNLEQLQPGVDQLLRLRKLRVLSLRAWTARDWFPWDLFPEAFPHLERLFLGSWETRDSTFPDALKAAMPRTQILWSLPLCLLSFFDIKLDRPKRKKAPKPEEPDLDLFIFHEDLSCRS